MTEKAGKFPFTKGIYKNMYKDRLWTMRQYAGFASAEESNERYKYLLEQGVAGLSIAFDLPTQIGYDSDHEMAEGEIGKVGVPICSVEDMKLLFNDIDLEQISTSMTINSTASIILAMYIVTAEENGANLKNLNGTVQNDILKEYIARGTYIYPPKPSMRIITDMFDFCSKNIPKWNVISISGYHIREAGSSVSQELAFTFANGIEYVQSAIDKGLDPNEFGQQISFFFNSHNGFFEEISKFRAARKIWSNIMKNRFSVKNKKALMCRFHVQTGGSTLTAQQADNNTVRTTIQAMAAILGGAQSLHTNGFDEALSLPTDESAKLAIRTQQIIAYESGVVNFVDPIGDSKVVVNLTNKIINEVNSILDHIEKMGGAIAGIENGWIQSQISKSAYEYQTSIDKKDKKIVGVNSFKDKKDFRPDLHKINQTSIKHQLSRLKMIKNERDSSDVKLKLENIKNDALINKNLMPSIIKAVRARCTLGEISDILRECFGEFQQN